MFIDGDCLNDPLQFWPDKIDRQKPVSQVSTEHLHPFSQHESALEVARGYAAMDVLSGFVLLLPPADHELVFLNGYIELVAGKSCNRQRDTQPFRLAVRPLAPLDIVRRVTVGTFDDTVKLPLNLIKAQKERAG
jgi:hypothetical protein